MAGYLKIVYLLGLGVNIAIGNFFFFSERLALEMELGVDGLAPDNDDALGVKIATLVLITLCGFVLVLWTIVRYKLNMREKEAEF